MKTFKQHLIESKDRFIKKNKNLSKEQQKEIISMFAINRQAERKIDWNKSYSMTYDDFIDVLLQSKSGRKKKLKHQKIKGLSEGSDYVALRMKTKEYLAYIPLTYPAAQKFNTRELGICSGSWCIGSTIDAYHWNDEVISDQQVPIYIVNTRSKWVVMIQEGNRNYDIWNIENDPKKVHEGIPNFSVRKELLNPKQKSMYDEIREDYYSDNAEGELIDIGVAEQDFDSIIYDINESASEMENAQDYFNQRCYEIKRDTQGNIDEEIIEKQEIIESLQSQKEESQSNYDMFDNYSGDLSDDDDIDSIEIDGEYYDEDEIGWKMNDIDNEIEQFDSEIEELELEISSLQQTHEEIDVIEYYDMADNDDIDWSDYPPSEEDIGVDISIPSTYDTEYSSYFDLMVEHGYEGYHNGCNSDIHDHIIESRYGGSSYSDGQEILSHNGWYHPDIINEQ